MSDKAKELLKGLFFLLIGICFAVMAFRGIAATKKYPWIGAALCFLMTVNYVKKAFDR